MRKVSLICILITLVVLIASILPINHISAFNARTLVYFTGFEGNTFDVETPVNTNGVISATHVHTGSYAYELNTVGSFTTNTATLRESFWIYIATSLNQKSILAKLGDGTKGTVISLGSDNYIYNGATKGNTAITTSTWHRISFSVLNTTTNKVFLDGLEETNLANGTNSTAAQYYIGIGTAATTGDLFFDDLAIDNTASTTDLGDIRTVLSLPNATGTNSGFDTPVGDTGAGKHWENVNDLPSAVSDADYNQQAGNSSVVDTYNIQDTTTLSMSNVVSVNIIIRYKLGASGGGTGQAVDVLDNGTLYPTAVTAISTFGWGQHFYATMPDGGAAWTDARFNAFEIGMRSTGGSKDTFISVAWCMVAYAAIPGDPSSLASPTQGSTTIDLTWTKGAQADETLIRYRSDGTYPTSTSDGTQGYLGTGSSTQLTGLSASTTYKIRAWAYSSPLDLYSSGTADLTQATTGATATITLSAATSVTSTAARLNGNITDAGGDNPTVTVYYGKTDHPGTAVGWDANSAPTSPAQPQGVAAFYLDVSSLDTGTTYYFTAKATNSSGTTWPAASQSFVTIPAAPTGVTATDGTYPDKVRVEWTKSTGATKYKVLRGAVNDSGDLGDVALYDDTAGAAPTITPGTADASNGTSYSYVTLTLSGQSASNGSTESYTVYAGNASGYSSASSADNGYKGTTTLTFQWQMSLADSDANYSDITGGTTNPYNDTAAPGGGVKRYFRCGVSMTGATIQYSTGDEGWKGEFNISNTPDTKAFGVVQPSTTYYAKGTAPNNPVVDGDCTFTITNSGIAAIKVLIKCSDFPGGVGWTLVSGSPSTNQVKLVAYYSGQDPATGKVLTTSDQTFIATLASSGTKKWDFSMLTGSSFTDGVEKQGTITLTAAIP